MGDMEGPTIVRVSRRGRVTIPKPLQEKFGIETPDEVFVYGDGDRIIVEPIPSIDDLGGIHDDERDDGEILERVRDRKADEKRRKTEQASRLRPSASDDGE